jgi:hypothetical protein
MFSKKISDLNFASLLDRNGLKQRRQAKDKSLLPPKHHRRINKILEMFPVTPTANLKRYLL